MKTRVKESEAEKSATEHQLKEIKDRLETTQEELITLNTQLLKALEILNNNEKSEEEKRKALEDLEKTAGNLNLLEKKLENTEKTFSISCKFNNHFEFK